MQAHSKHQITYMAPSRLNVTSLGPAAGAIKRGAPFMRPAAGQRGVVNSRVPHW